MLAPGESIMPALSSALASRSTVAPIEGTEGEVPERRVLAHARLDRCLARLAGRPERFRRDLERLAAALDSRGIDLEISDPGSWRRAKTAARVAVERQFRFEIDGLRPMGREEELRLALRIEFARTRLERVLNEHGLRCDDPDLPPVLLRRRQEWHALRIEMVERNLHLVLLYVEYYRHVPVERSDLIQAAAVALFPAVDKFDWRRGVYFRTYAVHWLKQGFRGQLYGHSSTVRVPVHLQKSVKHVTAAIQRLGDPHASIAEIAREAGLRPSTVAATRRMRWKLRSLDAPLDPSDETRTLAAELAQPDDESQHGNAPEEPSIESRVAAALARLCSRERRVVQLRFGIGGSRPHRYSEIAAELGVSLERARQIVVRALSRMRSTHLRRVLEEQFG
jgi:RNA polymerase sigma factor (sigma-70 family)